MLSTENDALAQLLVDDKIRGKSYLEISQKHGIPADEVISILRDVYASTQIKDQNEYRALLQLRLEKIIDKLWDGLEEGSFKHGEAVIKAVQQLQELHDLNEKTITHEINIITDAQASKIFEVLKKSNNTLYGRVAALPLTPEAKAALSAWPEWTAESATEAVEEVIYAEVIEED